MHSMHDRKRGLRESRPAYLASTPVKFDVGELPARIKRLRAALRLTQAALANLVGVTQPTVNRWERGQSWPEEAHARRLADLAHVDISVFRYGDAPAKRTRDVPIVGYVGAGPLTPVDDHAQGAGLDELELDERDGVDPIAVIVRGDSMHPVYRDGDVVRGSRRRGADTAACVGKDCIVKLAAGEILLKAVHKGSRRGTFTLASYNPAETPLQDVRIEWCAPVLRVYRR